MTLLNKIVPASAVLLATTTIAIADIDNGLGYGHMRGYDSGWMFLGPLIWLIVIAAIVWLVASSGRSWGRADDNNKIARNALDLRFANGEIDASEYAERKKLLG